MPPQPTHKESRLSRRVALWRPGGHSTYADQQALSACEAAQRRGEDLRSAPPEACLPSYPPVEVGGQSLSHAYPHKPQVSTSSQWGAGVWGVVHGLTPWIVTS